MISSRPYHILLHTDFDVANVHRRFVSRRAKLIEAQLLVWSLEMPAELFGEVLARQLDNELHVTVFLPRRRHLRNLVVVELLHVLFHLTNVNGRTLMIYLILMESADSNSY